MLINNTTFIKCKCGIYLIIGNRTINNIKIVIEIFVGAIILSSHYTLFTIIFYN